MFYCCLWPGRHRPSPPPPSKRSPCRRGRKTAAWTAFTKDLHLSTRALGHWLDCSGRWCQPVSTWACRPADCDPTCVELRQNAGGPGDLGLQAGKDAELLLVQVVDIMAFAGPAGICRAYRLMSLVNVRPVTETAALDWTTYRGPRRPKKGHQGSHVHGSVGCIVRSPYLVRDAVCLSIIGGKSKSKKKKSQSKSKNKRREKSTSTLSSTATCTKPAQRKLSRPCLKHTARIVTPEHPTRLLHVSDQYISDLAVGAEQSRRS